MATTSANHRECPNYEGRRLEYRDDACFATKRGGKEACVSLSNVKSKVADKKWDGLEDGEVMAEHATRDHVEKLKRQRLFMETI